MTHSKNDLSALCWTIHNWWKPVSDIPDRSLSTLDFKVLRMYAHTPPQNSFFMFLGLSSLDKLYPSISTSAFFTLEFSQDSEIAKIAHLDGTNMAAGNHQKHLQLRFATKPWIYTFSNTWAVEIAEFPEITHFFNQQDGSLGRHVIAKSRKSLEIQT